MTTTTAQVAVPVRARRRPASFYVNQVIRYTVLCVIGLILFTPFILAFLGSFKSNAEIVAWPPTLLPAQWRLENWTELLTTDMGGLPQESGMIAFGGTMGLVAFMLSLVVDRVTSVFGEGKRIPIALLLVAVVTTLAALVLVTAIGSEWPFIGKFLMATGGMLALSLVGFTVAAVSKQRWMHLAAGFLLWPAMALIVAWLIPASSAIRAVVALS